VKHCGKTLEVLDTSGFQLRNLLFKMTLNEDTVDDLMQELFLKLAGSYRFARCENPFAYAWRTAVNLALDYRRRKRPAHLTGDQDMENLDNSRPVDKLIQDEHISMIINEIYRMKHPGRDVLIMRYLEQRSFSEIAAVLEKKENHIRSVASKALARLRSNLNGQLEIKP